VERSGLMMEAFKEWVRPKPWKVLAVEREFVATLAQLGITGPFASEVVTCRTDLIVESNGVMFIPDFKTAAVRKKKDGTTAGLPAMPKRDEYTLSLQAAVNLRLGRLTYPNLKRFGILRVKSNGPPWDFKLDFIRIPKPVYAGLPELLHRAVQVEAAIDRKMKSGIPLERQGMLTGACFGRYGACDYWDVCTAERPEERAAILKEDFRRG
jgi:hypothetical protein